jgi:hypothetical protein
MVYDNVSFRQVDSEPLRELIRYISPRAGEAMPSSKTIRDWIMQSYSTHKAAVKQELQNHQQGPYRL